MDNEMTVVVEEPVIGTEQVREAADRLRKYKQGKSALERRIVENEKWYRIRHWDVVGRREIEDMPSPSSAWLFNMLANKHADMMDNYPAPNVLPREMGDEQDADSLSSIIPVVLERNKFEETYDKACWYKIKFGTAAYGIFWDQTMENGLGDICVTRIDLLNLFWEPGKDDLQDSADLFIVSLADEEAVKQRYPDQAEDISGGSAVDVADYAHDDSVDTSDKVVVIDWYYRRMLEDGRTVVHLCKFCGDAVLFASENDAQYAGGYYDHGMYPVVLDVLFPCEGQAAGFGYIDIAKDPQLYIDRLDADILLNADLCGMPRWMISESAGVSEREFADFTKRFVHVAGRLDDDHVRQIKVEPISTHIVSHRQAKIEELKETSGNRDVSAGGTTSGVTAASAIAALQEAGNKLSRDALKGTYRAFTSICEICIELIRQFYDEARCFRIEGEDGRIKYIEYSNVGLVDQPLPAAYPGAENEVGFRREYRRPVFDISVKPQRSNPFNRVSQNELAKELYAGGFFDPSRADQALAALDLMDFEGKSKVVQRVQSNGGLYQMVMQQQQTMERMAQTIEQLTGTVMPRAQDAASTSGGGTFKQQSAKTGAEQAQARAAANAEGAYQQRIAKGAPA